MTMRYERQVLQVKRLALAARANPDATVDELINTIMPPTVTGLVGVEYTLSLSTGPLFYHETVEMNDWKRFQDLQERYSPHEIHLRLDKMRVSDLTDVRLTMRHYAGINHALWCEVHPGDRSFAISDALKFFEIKEMERRTRTPAPIPAPVPAPAPAPTAAPAPAPAPRGVKHPDAPSGKSGKAKRARVVVDESQ